MLPSVGRRIRGHGCFDNLDHTVRLVTEQVDELVVWSGGHALMVAALVRAVKVCVHNRDYASPVALGSGHDVSSRGACNAAHRDSAGSSFCCRVA